MRLNRAGFDHARRLIDKGRVVKDERDDWSEHRPSASKENAFISKHGYEEYGKWHLGLDEHQAEDTKARYAFQYGGFQKVHRSGVISAESRAAQYRYPDIADGAAKLLEMIDGARHRRTA